MKKIICLILASTILLLTAGCDNTVTTPDKTVNFYYVHNKIQFGTQSGIITPTAIEYPGEKDDYLGILELYFRGPTNYDCLSPFPAGTTVEEFLLNNNRAEILLSPHMSTISGVKFMTACTCLTRTVIEMTGVRSVKIQIQYNQINGEDALTLSLDSFAYCDAVTGNYDN